MKENRHGDVPAQFQLVLRMLARERLTVDAPAAGRTMFLSHLGAQEKLLPGPWVAHRDLLHALALANLSPAQRTSLARAVLVEHGHEFGVGRLRLSTLPSGLPFGGSSLAMQPRTGELRCLYTWALGPAPGGTACDWLLLRPQPGWACPDPPLTLACESLEMLVALGGEIVVLVRSAVGARQIADMCRKRVPLAAHPRFAPHLEGLDPDAPVLLWPHDALRGAGLRRREVTAVVLVDGSANLRREVDAWLAGRAAARRPEIATATCPGRIDRARLAAFWQACARPRVLLRGDSRWAHEGAAWLRQLGAEVHVHGEPSQLGLFGSPVDG